MKKNETNTRKIELEEKGKIVDALAHYVEQYRHYPKSTYEFLRDSQLQSKQFRQHFQSLKELKKEVWIFFFDQTVQLLEAEEVYFEYSAREKMLAFFYTWLQTLSHYRKYVAFVWNHKSPLDLIPKEMKPFKRVFKKYIDYLLKAGKETGEIAKRPLIGQPIEEIAWLQLPFILGFWIKDHSRHQEKTDVAVDKTVNMTFDFLSRTPVDSMFDFTRFLFKNRELKLIRWLRK